MRISGKYGKIMISTTTTAVTSEVATLNTISEVIDGVTYAAYRVATLAHYPVFHDFPDTPITVVFAVGGGSALPSDLSYTVDLNRGKVILSSALTSGNTVTVSYSYAGGLTEVGDMQEWSFDEKVKELDVTAFNDEWELYIPLQKNWDASLSGHLNLVLWNAAVGGAGSGGLVPAGVVYLQFYLNRSTVSATNPYWQGQGMMSVSVKTPFSGKVEITAKVKGTSALAKIIA